MTKPKKPTKRKPASVLAWCALYDGKIKPGWCCQHRDIAKQWADNNPGGELVRVRITAASEAGLLAHYLELRAKVNQDAEEGDKQSKCEGCNEADGIAFTADDVWLCMECLEGCDVEPNP